MTEATVDYGMRVELPLSYDEAIERVTAALKAEGFGVLTEIDVQATLKKKIGADFRRYIILGACNPRLAYRALSAELEIGLMLPCNVIAYETEDGATISIVDPQAMLGVGASPALSDVAAEAREKLQRVAETLRNGN